MYSRLTQHSLAAGLRMGEQQVVLIVDDGRDVRELLATEAVAWEPPRHRRILMPWGNVLTMAKLLVADDSAAVRDLCARMLRTRGHTVITAADGAEAIALYREHAPDGVLLDVHMPGVDGMAALEVIRATNPAARIAMLTSVQDASMVRRAFELGARDYVLKPFHADRLDTALERLLAL